MSFCLNHLKFFCQSITDESYLPSAEDMLIFLTVLKTRAESLSATLIKLTQVPFPMRTVGLFVFEDVLSERGKSGRGLTWASRVKVHVN